MTEGKFNVGDRIIGVKGNTYAITGEGSICEVVSQLDEYHICVRLIEPADFWGVPLVGHEYAVEPHSFELLAPKIASSDIDALLFGETREE